MTTPPVLMAVDDDPGTLGELDATLRRRCEADYPIFGEASPEIALRRLKVLRPLPKEQDGWRR